MTTLGFTAGFLTTGFGLTTALGFIIGATGAGFLRIGLAVCLRGIFTLGKSSLVLLKSRETTFGSLMANKASELKSALVFIGTDDSGATSKMVTADIFAIGEIVKWCGLRCLPVLVAKPAIFFILCRPSCFITIE